MKVDQISEKSIKLASDEKYEELQELLINGTDEEIAQATLKVSAIMKGLGLVASDESPLTWIDQIRAHKESKESPETPGALTKEQPLYRMVKNDQGEEIPRVARVAEKPNPPQIAPIEVRVRSWNRAEKRGGWGATVTFFEKEGESIKQVVRTMFISEKQFNNFSEQTREDLKGFGKTGEPVYLEALLELKSTETTYLTDVYNKDGEHVGKLPVFHETALEGGSIEAISLNLSTGQDWLEMYKLQLRSAQDDVAAAATRKQEIARGEAENHSLLSLHKVAKTLSDEDKDLLLKLKAASK